MKLEDMNCGGFWRTAAEIALLVQVLAWIFGLNLHGSYCVVLWRVVNTCCEDDGSDFSCAAQQWHSSGQPVCCS